MEFDLPRIEKQEIDGIYEAFANSTSIKQILELLPCQLLILNEFKQVVFGNKVLEATHGIKNITDIIALRPGELIQCDNTKGGNIACGNHPDCNYCAINKTFFAVKESLQKEHAYGQVEYLHLGKKELFEYEIFASPLEFNGKMYFIITLFDISKQKENEVFQRLFFHDILNISGSLESLFLLLRQETDITNNVNLLKLAHTMTSQLTDEIQRQRQILSAETGVLVVENSKVNTRLILQDIYNIMSQNKVALNKTIHIDVASVEFDFITDRTILVRVLTNMVKNALEAETVGAEVTIGVFFEHGLLQFWVHNKSVIVEDMQHNIFKKSISTKGVGRGLGTYSMKLLGERFLHGHVSFISNESDGTVFSIGLLV